MEAKHETFLPLQQAALRLGVPAAWLRTEAKADRIPSLRAGRRLLLNLPLVERALLLHALSDKGAPMTVSLSATTRPTHEGATLLLDAAGVAFVLHLSTKTVRRMLSAGKLPPPLRLGLGHRVLRWRAEIESWVAAGCPPAAEWEAIYPRT